jgi:DnaJ-class molecular chaperone
MSMGTYAFRKEDGTIIRYRGAGYGKILEHCKRCDGRGEEEGDFGPKACGGCGGRGETDVGDDPERGKGK